MTSDVFPSRGSYVRAMFGIEDFSGKLNGGWTI